MLGTTAMFAFIISLASYPMLDRTKDPLWDCNGKHEAILLNSSKLRDFVHNPIIDISSQREPYPQTQHGKNKIHLVHLPDPITYAPVPPNSISSGIFNSGTGFLILWRSESGRDDTVKYKFSVILLELYFSRWGAQSYRILYVKSMPCWV